jgi:hypothetical protein
MKRRVPRSLRARVPAKQALHSQGAAQIIRDATALDHHDVVRARRKIDVAGRVDDTDAVFARDGT